MVRIDQVDLLSAEEKRLKEDREKTKYWKKWGPYVAERQWATGIYPTSFVVLDLAADNIGKFVRITVLMVMLGAVSSVSSFNQWQLIVCRLHSRRRPLKSFQVGRGWYCRRFRYTWVPEHRVRILE
jgi:hypothetical protein